MNLGTDVLGVESELSLVEVSTRESVLLSSPKSTAFKSALELDSGLPTLEDDEAPELESGVPTLADEAVLVPAVLIAIDDSESGFRLALPGAELALAEVPDRLELLLDDWTLRPRAIAPSARAPRSKLRFIWSIRALIFGLRGPTLPSWILGDGGNGRSSTVFETAAVVGAAAVCRELLGAVLAMDIVRLFK